MNYWQKMYEEAKKELDDLEFGVKLILIQKYGITSRKELDDEAFQIVYGSIRRSIVFQRGASPDTNRVSKSRQPDRVLAS